EVLASGRPLFLVYRPALLPDPLRTTDTWRAEAQRLGFPDLYLCWVHEASPPDALPWTAAFDAAVGPAARSVTTLRSLRGPVGAPLPYRTVDYRSTLARRDVAVPHRGHLPCVAVGWDDSPRRHRAATVVVGATPEAFGQAVRRAVEQVSAQPASAPRPAPGPGILFIDAWNRWGEGCHLEPDQEHGRRFLEAARSVLVGGATSPPAVPLAAPLQGGQPARSRSSREASVPTRPFNLDVQPGPGGGTASEGSNVDRPGTDIPSAVDRLVHRLAPGSRPRVVSLHGAARRPMAGTEATLPFRVAAGVEAGGGPLPVTSVQLTRLGISHDLRAVGEVDLLFAPDVLAFSSRPVGLLEDLATWARAHGDPLLVVWAPNLATSAAAGRLLCGDAPSGARPGAGREGPRALTAAAGAALLAAAGWDVLDREDVRHGPGADDPDTNPAVPEEIGHALTVISASTNPCHDVATFVWAARARLVGPATGGSSSGPGSPPPTATGHVRPPDITGLDSLADAHGPLVTYLVSVGLLGSACRPSPVPEPTVPEPTTPAAGTARRRDPPWLETARHGMAVLDRLTPGASARIRSSVSSIRNSRLGAQLRSLVHPPSDHTNRDHR
ncbi:MAG: glycoside hydrolase family 99-like domain-containing protein, partial [Acidimicrobiales bacterium]